MLTFELARRLADAGLPWEPAAGDRFVVPNVGVDEVFYISELTINVQRFATGDVLGFNGTTEWALDSVERDQVVWFPREDQLRAALGSAFVALEALGEGYAAVLAPGSRSGVAPQRFVDIEPERAYARALLHLLESPSKGQSSGSA